MKAFLNILILLGVCYGIYYFYTLNVSNGIPLSPADLAQQGYNFVTGAINPPVQNNTTSTTTATNTAQQQQQSFDAQFSQQVASIDAQVYNNGNYNSHPALAYHEGMLEDWEICKWQVALSDGYQPPSPVPCLYTDYSNINTQGQYYLPPAGNALYAVTNQDKVNTLSAFVAKLNTNYPSAAARNTAAALSYLKTFVQIAG